MYMQQRKVGVNVFQCKNSDRHRQGLIKIMVVLIAELQSLIEIDNAMADLRYIVSIDTKRMYSSDCPYHTLHALRFRRLV